MTTRVIQPLEEEIVSLALDRLGYLASGSGGTCQSVADAAVFESLVAFSPPFVLVKYGGEVATPPKEIGRNISQLCTIQWMAFVGALSFSAAGEGRTDNVGGNRGIYSILDDLFDAWEGRPLRSVPSASKLTFVSNTPPGVESHRVTAIQTWSCTVQRRSVPVLSQ